MLGGRATILDVLLAAKIAVVGCHVYVKPAVTGEVDIDTVFVKQTVGLLATKTGLIVGKTQPFCQEHRSQL